MKGWCKQNIVLWKHQFGQKEAILITFVQYFYFWPPITGRCFHCSMILLNLGGSVYGVWVLVNKLNLYNLVVVYTIGSMADLRHWFYPKDKSLLWQQLYRFLTKQFIMFKCNNIFKYNNNITFPWAIIINMRSPLWNFRSV